MDLLNNEIKERHIDFSPPDISEEEIKEVVEVLRSGWITTGLKTKKLEMLLAEYIGTKKVVCLSSATMAEELILRVLGIGVGDEVIVPAYTYSATAAAVIHVGAKVVFIDSQPNSIEMDYDAVEKAVNEHTKAIIPVDLGGVICDYKRLFEIVERQRGKFVPKSETELGGKIQKSVGRILVIADCAHALGAKSKLYNSWRMAGNIADFSFFSFHAVKNLTTAEGGAVTWREILGIDNEEIYRFFQLYSLHGQSKDALAKNQLGAWEYDIIGPWYKCNMTDVMAGIGLAQVNRYSDILKIRKNIIEKYDQAFKPLEIETLLHYTDEKESSGHLYITRIPGINQKQRQEIIVKMAEVNIVTNVHYKPLPMMTAYKNMGFQIKDYPNSYDRYVNEITLPLHTRLTDEDVDYVIYNFRDVLKKYI